MPGTAVGVGEAGAAGAVGWELDPQLALSRVAKNGSNRTTSAWRMVNPLDRTAGPLPEPSARPGTPSKSGCRRLWRRPPWDSVPPTIP